MKKTIQIDGRDVKFSNNASLFNIYKNQFGKDILSVIMPLFSEFLTNSDALFSTVINDGAKAIKPSEIALALEGVFSLEMVDFLQFAWAMAKCADRDTLDYDEWLESFEDFPIYDVYEELLPMLFRSVISKKKLGKLKAKLKKLKST